MPLPATGLPHAAVLDQLRAARTQDADWAHGRTFSLVYFAGEEVLAVMRDAYAMYIHENGLSLDAFPSLRRMEADVLRWSCDLFSGGPTSAGSLTSGGTESILMACKAARDWARLNRPQATTPHLLVPTTAHPAFDKAAHTLGIGIRHVPVGPDCRADVAATAAALDDNTILVVGSAFSFPHGVVDDIPALAALAKANGVLCHVDACLGGFLLAFAPEAGRAPVDFDFRVSGVTSMSADLHKYGYAAKGSSIVMYHDRSLRTYQFFAAVDWPGGVYASPTMAGTRPGGGIAAAWAVMRHLGRDGYVELTRRVLDTSDTLRAGIAAVPGLRLLGDARHSVIAFTADTFDIFAVEEALKARGWHLDRLQGPSGLQMIVSPAHVGAYDAFLQDLRDTTREVRDEGRVAAAGAAIYGALATLPDRALVRELVLGWLDGLDVPDAG